MKKLFVYGLSIALVAGTASCKKSSKGKMSNEWNLSAMSQTSSDTDANGDTSTSTMDVADGAITMVETDANGDATTLTGTVTASTWTISKDGTWTRTMDFNITSYTAGGTSFDVNMTMASTDAGTWDFLGGVNGDFKKNERVVFNTTSSSSSQTIEVGGTSSTDTSSDTYAEGENSEVMVIVESKGKELQMSSDAANSNTNTPDGGSASTTSGTSAMTVTLTQE